MRLTAEVSTVAGQGSVASSRRHRTMRVSWTLDLRQVSARDPALQEAAATMGPAVVGVILAADPNRSSSGEPTRVHSQPVLVRELVRLWCFAGFPPIIWPQQAANRRRDLWHKPHRRRPVSRSPWAARRPAEATRRQT